MHRSGLNTIEVSYKDENSQPMDYPDEASTWQTTTDPLQIEERLLARNIEHFGQAQGTLFATEYFQRAFGYSSVTTEVKQLISKELKNDNYPTMTRGATTLLTLLSNNQRLPPL